MKLSLSSRLQLRGLQFADLGGHHGCMGKCVLPLCLEFALHSMRTRVVQLVMQQCCKVFTGNLSYAMQMPGCCNGLLFLWLHG